MFYDLISLYIVGKQSTNVFVQGEQVSAQTDGKFGVYDADKDVIYLYPNEEKRLRTLIFFTKTDSKQNALVFNGYYELSDEPNEFILKYQRVG